MMEVTWPVSHKRSSHGQRHHLVHHHWHHRGLACRKDNEGGGFGLLGDLVVGIVGAVLGGFLFGLLGISSGGLIGSLITATVGAIVLIFLVRLIKRA
jgi:uncharacterized membrane protein YeaQ/YmgE (transglycosylase-associated protein family)